MAVTPTGILSLPLLHLLNSLANSSSFRTWSGAANVAAAKTLIHYVSFPVTAPPWASIDWDRSSNFSATATGLNNQYEQEGTLSLILRGVPLAETDLSAEDEQIRFMNSVGAILLDILQLSANVTETDNYLNITAVTHGFPERPTDQMQATQGDFIQVVLIVTFRGFA